MQDQVTEKSKDKYSIEVKTPQQFSFQIAVVLTVLIIGFSVLIWLGALHVPASPYEAHDSFAAKAFNIADFGTYVSGVFTSLSFIWLGVNALQQREDLKLQREEMQENNEHQQKQADQLEAAAKISLENSRIQKEIYASEKFQPHLQTIYLSLLLKSAPVRVQPNVGLSEEILEMIRTEFRSYREGKAVIHLFLVSNAIPIVGKDPDHSDPYTIISKINNSMTALLTNLQKIEKISSKEPNAFQFFYGKEYIEDLNNLFNELERFLGWLEPKHASSLRSLCKLDDVKECFKLIDKIFH